MDLPHASGPEERAQGPSRGGRGAGRAEHHADSAGTAWAGRTLAPTPFAGDDGSVPPALAALLSPAPGEVVDVAALVAALPGQRLIVPVVALAGGEARIGGDSRTDRDSRIDRGSRIDRDGGADMALPTLRAPDGRAALPVFSSVAQLSAWDAGARPVAVEARRVAVSAVADGQELLVLDVAGAAPVVIARPAVWALAQGRSWTPSPRDPEVAAAVGAALDGAAQVIRTDLEPGQRAELRVALTVTPGLDATALRRVTERVAAALAASDVVAERVDSLELVVR